MENITKKTDPKIKTSVLKLAKALNNNGVPIVTGKDYYPEDINLPYLGELILQSIQRTWV